MQTILPAFCIGPVLGAALAVASAATAQVGYGSSPYGSLYGRPATIGEVHRYEMDRLRGVADANAALARQQNLQTQLTLQQLQAARRPTPAQPEAYRPLRSVEVEREAREGANDRRETVVSGVTQIDAWLDRAPN